MAKKTDNNPPSDKPGRRRTWPWLCALFFASAWMFILGVLVGRGTAPVHFDVEALQKELAALKEPATLEQKPYMNRSEPDRPSPELDFHEALRKNKVEPQLALEVSRAEKRRVKPQKLPVSAHSKPAHAKASESASRSAARSPEKSGAAAPGAFAIQVAALKDAGSAEAKAAEFSRKGYQAYSTSGTAAGRGTWHRVRIGNFHSRAEALRVLKKLKQDKINGFIVEKK